MDLRLSLKDAMPEWIQKNSDGNVAFTFFPEDRRSLSGGESSLPLGRVVFIIPCVVERDN
jgi:hypothetical protein